MLFIAVVIGHVIVSLALIAIILLQAGRGGLSESFGGAPTQSLFGTQTATFLTRTTTACAVLFFTTCLTLAILSSQHGRSLMERVQPLPATRAPFSAQTPAAKPSTPGADAATAAPAAAMITPATTPSAPAPQSTAPATPAAELPAVLATPSAPATSPAPSQDSPPAP